MDTEGNIKINAEQHPHVNIIINGELIASNISRDGDTTVVNLSVKDNSHKYKAGKSSAFVGMEAPTLRDIFKDCDYSVEVMEGCSPLSDWINQREREGAYPYTTTCTTIGQSIISRHIKQVNELAGQLDTSEIERARQAIYHANRVFVFGNGGSNATADHLVCDLLKACGKSAFSSSLPTLTAYANDNGYSNAIVDQLWRHDVDSGDAIVLISTSGNSKNVVKVAKKTGELINPPTIIALTANDGGKLSKYANIEINVPTDKIEVAEDVHSIVCHAIVRALK